MGTMNLTERLVLDVQVPDWQWESLEIWGENKQVVGHKIKMGSIIELQLWLEPRHIVKFWIRRSNQQKTWSLDPRYDMLQELDLGRESEPVRRLIRPLRPDTNLVYFEGRVEKIASVDSRSEPGSKMVQALIDCGFPLVLEDLASDNLTTFPVTSEGQELIGVCRLFGAITVSNTLFRAPVKAKVLAARISESVPGYVLLKVEPISTDANVDARLFYSRLNNKNASTI